MRGDVHELPAPRGSIGSEQSGRRSAVIVQSDLLHLSTCLVAPTSTSARATDFRPEIELQERVTRVLIEQTTAVSPERLGRLVGRVSHRELSDIDAAPRAASQRDH